MTAPKISGLFFVLYIYFKVLDKMQKMYHIEFILKSDLYVTNN